MRRPRNPTDAECISKLGKILRNLVENNRLARKQDVDRIVQTLLRYDLAPYPNALMHPVDPTALRRRFGYNRERGYLFDRETTEPAGDRSDNSNPRRYISIAGIRYPEEYLIWLYEHHKPPPGLIAHVNGEVDDNRIVNLTIEE